VERESSSPSVILCLTKVTTVSDSLSLHLRGLRLSNNFFSSLCVSRPGKWHDRCLKVVEDKRGWTWC